MKTVVALLLLGVAATGAQQFNCPHEYGFYADPVRCDKYYACEGGVASEKLCGNGLAFDDSDPEFLKENCDYAHNVPCGERTETAPPISTPHCPYLFGVFPDQEDCDVFWSCWDGEASRYQCGPGLAYDRKMRICTWVDSVKECSKINTRLREQFACPVPGEIAVAGSFSRHAHPDDCRQYYVCFDGIPREYGCPIGTVYQIGETEGSGQCSDPEFAPGCEDYYGNLDLGGLRKAALLLGGIDGGSRKPAVSSRPRDSAIAASRSNVNRQEAPQSSSSRVRPVANAEPLKEEILIPVEESQLV